MAYVQREPIGGLGENRIWSILTLENAIGAAVGGGAMYGLSQLLGVSGQGFGPGFWLQFFMIGLGVVVGATVTIRVRGLSLLDRVTLAVGFHMRKMNGGHRIEPPIEASIWALHDDDDLLPLLDDDLLAAMNQGRADGRA